MTTIYQKQNQYLRACDEGFLWCYILQNPRGRFEKYQSPWGARTEGLYSLPKELITKIFDELDPASRTAASFTARPFKEIHPPFTQLDPTFLEDAAGHQGLLRWGVERGYSLCNAIEPAIREGNLELLGLMDARGKIFHQHSSTAIICGRLDVLKWLYERFGAQMLVPELFQRALYVGHHLVNLDILNWLKEIGCPPHPDIFNLTDLEYRRPDVQAWLQANYDFETRQPK